MDILTTILCFSLSCLIILGESPQVLVLLLVVQSFFVVTYLRLVRRVWYSYVLFLVFLGGILVIFVYISRLSSNIKLENIYKDVIKVFVCSVIVIRIVVLIKVYAVFTYYEITTSIDITIYSLLSTSRCTLYIFVVVYLLLALYCVCRMVKKSKGPLRKFN